MTNGPQFNIKVQKRVNLGTPAKWSNLHVLCSGEWCGRTLHARTGSMKFLYAIPTNRTSPHFMRNCAVRYRVVHFLCIILFLLYLQKLFVDFTHIKVLEHSLFHIIFHHHHHPSPQTSQRWVQASSPYERALAVVHTCPSVNCELHIQFRIHFMCVQVSLQCFSSL